MDAIRDAIIGFAALTLGMLILTQFMEHLIDTQLSFDVWRLEKIRCFSWALMVCQNMPTIDISSSLLCPLCNTV